MLRTFVEVLLDLISLLNNSEVENPELDVRIGTLITWMCATYAEFDTLMDEANRLNDCEASCYYDALIDVLNLWLGPKEV